MSEQQQGKEQKSAAMDLRYQNGKEVVKGGILGAFIGLAVIVPGGERLGGRHHLPPL